MFGGGGGVSFGNKILIFCNIVKTFGSVHDRETSFSEHVTLCVLKPLAVWEVLTFILEAVKFQLAKEIAFPIFLYYYPTYEYGIFKEYKGIQPLQDGMVHFALTWGFSDRGSLFRDVSNMLLTNGVWRVTLFCKDPNFLQD